MQIKVQDSLVVCQNFIRGKWILGEQGLKDVISPVNGKEIGQVSVPSQKQIDSAIRSAAEAQKNWARQPIKERSKILYQFRNFLLRDQDAISLL